jgi:AraC-like DNA-binding protein
MSTAHPVSHAPVDLERDRPVRRRTIDRLHIATVAPSRGRYVGALPPCDAHWPFAVLHAVAGAPVVDGHRLAEGELLVVTWSPVFVEVDPDNVLLVLRLPVEAIGPYASSLADVAGTPLPDPRGTTSLVAHLLTGLARATVDAAPENPAGLSQHVIGLITLMCADAARPGASPQTVMLEQAKQFIEARLADTELSPDIVADALHVSTRTLHRLFERDGYTISGWTRSRRLERCRIDLVDVALWEESVSSIGARHGLCDAAHFSRLFKATFGLSPRAYRARAVDGRAHERRGAIA